MKISILTLFPHMFLGFFQESIIKRAIEKNIVEIEIINIRDFAIDSHRTVDERPYGGGAGMVMRVDVLSKAIHTVKTNMHSRVILTSAKGKTYDQKKAHELSSLDHIIIIAGHYEGVDERVMKYVDEEISIGDFVMTGGEIATVAIVDSIVRLIPGVLKKAEATQEESFYEVSLDELIAVVGKTEVLSKLQQKKITRVKLLEYPQYTRPEEFEGMSVPEEFISGYHEKIRTYNLRKAYSETVQKRPDLLDIRKE